MIVYFSHNVMFFNDSLVYHDCEESPFVEHQLQEEFSKGKEWRLYEYVTRCLVALGDPETELLQPSPTKKRQILNLNIQFFHGRNLLFSGEDNEVLY